MANNASRRAGRTLIVFTLATVAMYVGLAVNGTWTPRLGLDLQGGTSITLQASTETGEDITPEKLEEAALIIDSRVNGTGVAEVEVSTQGNDTIIVEIPGQNRKDLVDLVTQTAQLRFRLVAASADGTAQPPAPEEPPAEDENGGDGDGDRDNRKGGQGKNDDGDGPQGDEAEPAGRAVSEGLIRAGETPAPDDQGDGQGDGPGQRGDEVAVPTNESSVDELLAWMRNPDPESVQKFAEFVCGEDEQGADNPAKPLIACDEAGNKYLLSPAMIEGTQLDDAGYGIPQGDVQYVVNLDFNGEATRVFADVTRAINGTGELFAIVLDGEVLSAPQVTSAILDGNAQITGDFTAAEAQSLANSLKYGALPLTFTESVVSEEGPTLAGDQLSAGIWAGAVGLGLVLIYALLYYRGLGIVVVASIGIAGALIYGLILFLSESAGVALTLPGVAGLIVGIGVTADSFIVLFERIRDEMRDGKSVRVAIESGWDRAKWTCVVADSVSLLAAVVLYIFAIGAVKGFAFMLGITTIIDLIVFFWFTKPMITWLAQFKFFNQGHKLSGLSPEQAGLDHIGQVATAGGVR